MRALTRIFISWLPLGVAITGLCVLVYTVAQQTFQQSVSDVSIRLTGDTAAELAVGEPVQIGWLVLQAWIALMLATFIAKGFARYFS